MIGLFYLKMIDIKIDAILDIIYNHYKSHKSISILVNL